MAQVAVLYGYPFCGGCLSAQLSSRHNHLMSDVPFVQVDSTTSECTLFNQKWTQALPTHLEETWLLFSSNLVVTTSWRELLMDLPSDLIFYIGGLLPVGSLEDSHILSWKVMIRPTWSDHGNIIAPKHHRRNGRVQQAMPINKFLAQGLSFFWVNSKFQLKKSKVPPKKQTEKSCYQPLRFAMNRADYQPLFVSFLSAWKPAATIPGAT